MNMDSTKWTDCWNWRTKTQRGETKRLVFWKRTLWALLLKEFLHTISYQNQTPSFLKIGPSSQKSTNGHELMDMITEDPPAARVGPISFVLLKESRISCKLFCWKGPISCKLLCWKGAERWKVIEGYKYLSRGCNTNKTCTTECALT